MSHPHQHPRHPRPAADAIREKITPRLLDGPRQALGGIVLPNGGVQRPFRRNALQHVRAAVFERDARAVDEVLDGAGYKDFLTFGQRSDSGPDVHGDAADVFAA